MERNELLNGLKEARDVLADRVPVIIAWRAVRILNELIDKLEKEQAEVA